MYCIVAIQPFGCNAITKFIHLLGSVVLSEIAATRKISLTALA